MLETISQEASEINVLTCKDEYRVGRRIPYPSHGNQNIAGTFLLENSPIPVTANMLLGDYDIFDGMQSSVTAHRIAQLRHY
jgi:hypothetical protein